MRLGPRYQVVDQLAAGGMGVVSLALRRSATGVSPVAIKQVHAHLLDDEEIVASFVDEARIASRIVHPNVVRVEDVEMVGERLVIVMEYVEGVPLSALLRNRETPLTIPVVRRIIVDALNGLHAAHELADEKGVALEIVHRDVSPHNLLVGTDGVTRVTDFGIAMAAGRIAATKADGTVKGKLQYLSPEQVFRKNLDRRTDVFAAGVVAWEALVGRRLFEGGTEGETLAMIIREPIDPPSVRRPDVPIDLDEACLRALERDPNRRFASAHDFARALEEGGPLATRSEIEALVTAQLGATLTARREHLAAMAAQPPSSSTSIDDDDDDDDDGPTRIRPEAPAATVSRAPARKRTSPLVLLVVGTVCVSGGLLVGFGARQGSPARAGTREIPVATAPPPAVLPPDPVPAGNATVASSSSLPAPLSAATSVKASVAPSPRPSRGGSRRSDAGRGRPFMPDDL